MVGVGKLSDDVITDQEPGEDRLDFMLFAVKKGVFGQCLDGCSKVESGERGHGGGAVVKE